MVLLSHTLWLEEKRFNYANCVVFNIGESARLSCLSSVGGGGGVTSWIDIHENCGFSPGPVSFFTRDPTSLDYQMTQISFLITLLNGWMHVLHNFRTGPLLSNDHPVFNAVEERGAFLNAFRERPEFMQNPLFAVVDALSTTD